MKKLIYRIKRLKNFTLDTFIAVMRSPAKRKQARYASYFNRINVKKNLVLYESSYGVGMVCNPYAIFKAFLEDESFNTYKHVWVLDKLENHQATIDEYKRYKNVHFVERESKKYFKLLVSAKYLINNTSFSAYFSKKPNQVYVNTWHSITVKKLGFDIPDGNITSGNMIRNLMASDYIISANKFTTERFKESYKLDGLYNGKIIEDGYPRNDLILKTKRDYIINKLIKAGVKIDTNKQVILYAPTWKGNDYFNPISNADDYISFIENISKSVDTNKYQILVKPHQAEYKKMSDEHKKSGIFIPCNIDTNEILSVVDILVSDYSSIFFDFMITNKPIIFYIPDLDEYLNYRGVYFNIDELPGPASKDISDISTWINDINNINEKYSEVYSKIRSWACEFDNGNVSKKVIDIVFKKRDKDFNIIEGLLNDKKKLLVYAGGLSTNGVTFSFLSLMNHIDYSKFDISLIVFNTKDEIIAQNCRKINHNVRVFARVGSHSGTVIEQIRDKFAKVFGFKSKLSRSTYPNKMYNREFKRCFGTAKFDYVVDFSGYGPFFNYLLMQADGAKRIIWQHADLKQDLERVVKGKERIYADRKRNILAVISLYPYYDKIVSCGQAIMKVNRECLSTPDTFDKFTFATNTINFDRIMHSLKTQSLFEYEGANYYVSNKTDVNDVSLNVSGIRLPESDKINFVSMGRLSPEKNQENLILAFADIYQQNKDCRLYIIGDGDLKKHLHKLISSLGLVNIVFLTGSLSNPFSFMKSCDCFIFPSKFEGQGLSVLEARMLNLPIVVSDFFAVQDVIMENGQYLIGKTQDDIYDGMKAFLDGKVPSNYIFNPAEYNRKAYSEFEELFN